MAGAIRINAQLPMNENNEPIVLVQDEARDEEELRSSFFRYYWFIMDNLRDSQLPLPKDIIQKIIYYYERLGEIAILLAAYYAEANKAKKFLQLNERIAAVGQELKTADIDVRSCTVTADFALLQMICASDQSPEKITLPLFNEVMSENYRKNLQAFKVLAGVFFPKEYPVDVCEELVSFLKSKDYDLWQKYKIFFHVSKLMIGRDDSNIIGVLNCFYNYLVQYLEQDKLLSLSEKEKNRILKYFIMLVKFANEEGVLNKIVEYCPVKTIKKLIFYKDYPFSVKVLRECNDLILSLKVEQRYSLLSACIGLLDSCTLDFLEELSEMAYLLVASDQAYYDRLNRIGFFQKILQRIGLGNTNSKADELFKTISFSGQCIAKICLSFAKMFDVMSENNKDFQQMVEVFIEEFLIRVDSIDSNECLSLAADFCVTCFDYCDKEEYARALKFFNYYMQIGVKLYSSKGKIREMMGEIVGFLGEVQRRSKHYKELLLMLEGFIFNADSTWSSMVFYKGCNYSRFLLWHVMLEIMIEKRLEERMRHAEFFDMVLKRVMQENSLDVLSRILIECISPHVKVENRFLLNLFDLFFNSVNKNELNDLNKLYKLGLKIYFKMCSSACFEESLGLDELRIKLITLMGRMQLDECSVNFAFILSDYVIAHMRHGNAVFVNIYVVKIAEHLNGLLEAGTLAEIVNIFNAEDDLREKLQKLRILLQPVPKENARIASFYLSILCQLLRDLPLCCKEFNDIMREIADTRTQYVQHEHLNDFIEGLLSKKQASVASLIQPFYAQNGAKKRSADDNGLNNNDEHNSDAKKPRFDDQDYGMDCA